jgi:ATP-dependent DNA helicase RecG
VARGAVAGICGAVTPSGTEPLPRVDAFVASTDGFELARKDFELRGAGNLVGTRQSGDDGLLVADLIEDESVMIEARADAHELFARDPALADPAHARLKKVILGRWGKTLGLGGVG